MTRPLAVEAHARARAGARSSRRRRAVARLGPIVPPIVVAIGAYVSGVADTIGGFVPGCMGVAHARVVRVEVGCAWGAGGDARDVAGWGP